jgi:hypothetical protein
VHGKCLLAERNPQRRNALALRAVSSQWSVRQLERAITGAAKQASAPSSSTTADARALNELAAAIRSYRVTVHALGDAFAIRVVAADKARAEAVLAHLQATANGPAA